METKMAYNKSKTDPVLGQQIHQHLLLHGVETPLIPGLLSKPEQIAIIEEKFRDIMEVLNLDLSNDSLEETPSRVAKMLVMETQWGLDFDAFPKCTTVSNHMGYDEMVVERHISVKSSCEHHFLPIVGKAYIAYIPKDKVLGLSKMPRIVEYFSRRPQIQERLTEQVYHALQYILGTDNIAVTIIGEHMCVSQRGVEDSSADTSTTKLGGLFKTESTVRAEFLSHISH